MLVRGFAVVVILASLPLSGHGHHLAGTSFTGTQLASVLLPPASFGAGYTAEKDSARSSGPRLETGAVRYRIGSLSCGEFEADYSRPGFGETAMATDSVDNPEQVPAYGQVVYQFRTSGAAVVFLGSLRAVAARCPSFARGDGARIKLRIAPADAVRGHSAFWLDETIKLPGAPTSEINSLLTASGTDVASIAGIGLISPPPTDPAPSALLARLIDRT
jgi:hypothetical protein